MGTRVLLVDDAAFALSQLERVVAHDLGFEVVGRAVHGLQAVDLASALRPDLITLDVRMPVMNGLTALKHIMSHRPVTTVMVSSFTREESHLTFDCLRCGALDFVSKPSARGENGIAVQMDELRDRLQCAAAMDVPDPRYCRLRRRQGKRPPAIFRPARHLVLVSAGRGGIAPLMKFFNDLPSGLGVAAIVVLDAPDRVIDSFSHYLSRFTGFEIKTPREEVRLSADTVYFVPSSLVSRVSGANDKAVLQVGPAWPGTSNDEALSELANSSVQAFGQAAKCVLMSGAASVSLEWLRVVGDSGGFCVVQEPSSAIESDVLKRAVSTSEVEICSDPHEIAREMCSRLLGQR